MFARVAVTIFIALPLLGIIRALAGDDTGFIDILEQTLAVYLFVFGQIFVYAYRRLKRASKAPENSDGQRKQMAEP